MLAAIIVDREGTESAIEGSLVERCERVPRDVEISAGMLCLCSLVG